MRLEHYSDRPLWLLALATVPLLWLWLARRERQLLQLRADWLGERAPQLSLRAPQQAARVRWSGCIGLCAAFLALAGPRFGAAPPAPEPAAADLVLCLDLSRSMLARDGAPTRLEAAHQLIQELVQRARGARMALVLFAGEARLRVPLTKDGNSLASIAAECWPETLASGGTNLGAALTCALSALPDPPVRPARILLLTDGEDLAGEGLLQAALAARRQCSVHCIGLGSLRGSKIAVEEEGGGMRYLRDREGREIVTMHDAPSLRALASAGAGTYATWEERETVLTTVLAEPLFAAQAASSAAATPVTRAQRFQLPLLLACLSWIFCLALPERRRR